MPEKSGVSQCEGPLTRYYEQMKQSILENGNYVDAPMDAAGGSLRWT